MAKQISSLVVALNATVGGFVNAFKSAENATTSLTSHLESVAGSIAKLTGAGLAMNAIAGAFDRALSIPSEAIASAGEAADGHARLAAVLKATGYAAGFTSEQLIAQADAFKQATTFDDDDIVKFQAVLATFRNVAGQTFTGATGIALDMASVMGTDLQSTAVQLGKALNDPVEGVTALRRVGVSFTEQQLAQIKAMQDAGNLAGAQAIVLAELKNEFGGVAEAMAKTPYGRFKQIGNEIGDVYKAIGTTLIDVGAKFANAFDVSGNISNAITYFTGLQGTISQLADVYAPKIASAVSGAFATVISMGESVYAAVSPTLYSIGNLAVTVFGGVGNAIVAAMATGTAVVGALSALIAGPLIATVGTFVAGFVSAGAAIVTACAPAIAILGAVGAAIGVAAAAIGSSGLATIFTSIGNAAGVAADYIASKWDAIASFTSAVFNSIYSSVSSAMQAVYNFTAPIVAGIYDFIAQNFQAAFETTVAVYGGIYDVISSTLEVVSTIVQATWGAITSVFNWGAGLIGLTTENAGTRISGVFQSIVKWGKWFADGISALLMVASYAISHIGDTFVLVGTQIELAVVKFGNQISYVFTGIIGPTLSWMATNWKSILTDMANLGLTVFENFASNAVAVFTNLPGLISGKVSFSDIFKPLTDGFQATLTTLPNIVDRQAGPLEQHLQRQADRLAQSYSQGLGDYMQQHMARNQGIAKAIENGVSGAASALTQGGPKPLEFPKPIVPQPDPIKLNTVGATKPLSDLTNALNSTKATAQNLDAVLTGSAEAMKLRYGAAIATVGQSVAAPAVTADNAANAFSAVGTSNASMIAVPNAQQFGNNADWLKSSLSDSSGPAPVKPSGASDNWMIAPPSTSSAPLDDGIWRDTNSASGATGSDGNGDVVGQQKQSNNFLSQLLNVTKSQQKINVVSM